MIQLSKGDGGLLGRLTPDMKSEIDDMSHFRMAWLMRFAIIGSPYLVGEVGEYFAARFEALGGMTPEISKQIGWDDPV